MDDIQKQVADRLKQATNILVTVKTDPTIDLLAACIGLSLVLDKVGKHATAVFSGAVPSAMEFLKPEETLEETPNSLRDFIISLDKSKADKLRYKVEDKVVRIFITPFKAGLSQDDLEFSQGDFNIDLLVALGVHEQGELDAAVTAHGRILHDAAVISINSSANGNLGTLNWVGSNVSSVSEMIASLAKVLDTNVFDEQIATALLTGIVAETARFSNDKTSPQTMSVAGELMAAGANQQLVATELQGSISVAAPGTVKADLKPSEDNGTLEITHSEPAQASETPQDEGVLEPAAKPEPEAPLPKVVENKEPIQSIQPNARAILPMPDPSRAGDNVVSDVASNNFTGGFGDEDHAGTGQSYLIDKTNEVKDGASGASALPPTSDLPSVAQPALDVSATDQPTSLPPIPQPPAADATTPMPSATSDMPTLADIENSVKNAEKSDAAAPAVPAATDGGPARLDDARQQVLDALKQGPQPLEPIASLNAQPLGAPLAHDDSSAADASSTSTPASSDEPAQPVAIEVDNEGNLTTISAPPVHQAPGAPPTLDMPLPPVASVPAADGSDQSTSSMAPPPVPPPMMPPAYTPSS